VGSFRADGLDLHYEVHGLDGPSAILLHGFTSSGASWVAQGWVDALVDAGISAVVADCRSHGASDRVYEPSRCTTALLAADVLALFDHLGIGAASLVGFSMGGAVALQVALDRPDRVRRLAVGGVGDAALNELHDPSDIDVLLAAFEEPAADLSERLRGIRRNAEAAGNDLSALAPFFRNGGWPGGLAAVAPLRMPALVFVAEHDQYMQPAGELIHRLAPTQTVLVPGRHHHDVLLDDEVRMRVVDFLRRSA
jgi:non-heme chloroperoxidase